MYWNKCFVCQTYLSAEKLSCPCNRRNFDPKFAYQTFLDNVQKLKEMNALPQPVMLPEGTTAQDLQDNKASWHLSCYRAFKTDVVNQEIRKNEDEVHPDTRHSKRLKGAMDYELCVFCEEDSAFRLHSYSTKNAEKNLCNMAMEMRDDDML